MKNLFAFLLIASLALNAGFVFIFVRSTSDGTGSSRLSVATSGLSPSAPVPETEADPLPETAAWASLPPAELPLLAARLRTAGFPTEMIRAIMAAIINEQFAARRKALDPNGENRPFWKNAAFDAKSQLAQMQLWREQEKALRDALGSDADSLDPLTLARQRQQFGNIAPEKMARAQEIVRDFEVKRQAVYSSGVYAAADREKIAALDKDQRASLAQILTPAELEEYDLRTSNTGRTLRSDLIAFNPTEAEFRTIFNLRQGYDEQWNRSSDNGLPSQEQMNQRSAAEKVLRDQITAALGPVRGADYEIATDYNYRRASQVVARLELPPETTKQLWDTQKEYQQRATDIRRGATNAQDRTTQLTALQQEANAKVGTMLGGTRGLEAYRQYGGTWLQAIAPRPPPPRN